MGELFHSIDLKLNIFYQKLVIPLALLLLLLLVPWLSQYYSIQSGELGLIPLDFSQWWGVFTAPLVHGSIDHLFSNAAALFFLSLLLVWFYHSVALKVVAFVWPVTGLLMFVLARPEFTHIGASGVVYAIAFFIIASGIILPHKTPRIVFFIVTLYYGSLIWGLFPIDNKVSWDGHVSGAIAGILAALLFYGKTKLLYPKATNEDSSHEAHEEFSDEYKQFEE